MFINILHFNSIYDTQVTYISASLSHLKLKMPVKSYTSLIKKVFKNLELFAIVYLTHIWRVIVPVFWESKKLMVWINVS